MRLELKCSDEALIYPFSAVVATFVGLAFTDLVEGAPSMSAISPPPSRANLAKANLEVCRWRGHGVRPISAGPNRGTVLSNGPVRGGPCWRIAILVAAPTRLHPWRPMVKAMTDLTPSERVN